MRSLPRFLLLASLALAGLTARHDPAAAATVMLVSPHELAARAQRIVHGTVLDRRSFWRNERIVTEARVLVLEGLKGATLGEVLRVSWPGGTVGQFAASSSGMPDMAAGDEVVLYLEAVGERNVPLGRTLGIYTVRAERAGGLRLARRDVTQLALVVPAGSDLSPHDVPRIRELPLDQLLSEIRGQIRAAAPIGASLPGTGGTP